MRVGGGEHTAFVLTRGWIIHPVERSASPACVCVCVTACLNVVMLYLAVVRVEMRFLTTTTLAILTTLQIILISYAWFSLNLANAKWLSALCMLLVVSFILLQSARYAAVKQQKPPCMFDDHSCFLSSFIQTNISDLFNLKYIVCGMYITDNGR